MRTFSVTVAVAVMLVCICIQENSAVPVSEVQELEEPMSNDHPVAAQEMSDDSWKMPYNRRKRNPAACRFCCNCCPNMSGCGVCCRF
ncbi:hepcidin-like [Brachionichthys hirsutus]|uniref:hepcidin-like n=1 Tax=Brachionichthys hirsutus TaxID=412623 RepID=UPI003604D51F